MKIRKLSMPQIWTRFALSLMMACCLTWAPRATAEGETRTKADTFVQRAVYAAFPRRSDTAAIYQTVLEESQRDGIDPILILAVIQNESRFHPYKRGSHGEIGLMQIKPSTARWILRERITTRELFDPVRNIRIGTAYLAILRRRFGDRHYLFLAAYNMGAGNVRRAIRGRVIPHAYAARVMRFYHRFYAEYRGLAGVV